MKAASNVPLVLHPTLYIQSPEAEKGKQSKHHQKNTKQ
jgi:hypothetical protein